MVSLVTGATHSEGITQGATLVTGGHRGGEASQEAPHLPLGTEDLQCPICQDQLQDAFVTTCGHTFCYACITAHLKHKRNCPNCSAYLTTEHIHPNFLLNKVSSAQPGTGQGTLDQTCGPSPFSGTSAACLPWSCALADPQQGSSGPVALAMLPAAHCGTGRSSSLPQTLLPQSPSASAAPVPSFHTHSRLWLRNVSVVPAQALQEAGTHVSTRELDAAISALQSARQTLADQEASSGLHILLLLLQDAR